MVPHGGRDPPALIVGWYDLRHIKWSLSSQVCLAAFYTLPRLRNVPALLNDMFPYKKYTIHKHRNSMRKLHKLEQLIFKKKNKSFGTKRENLHL